jgi:hypothetical protein
LAYYEKSLFEQAVADCDRVLAGQPDHDSGSIWPIAGSPPTSKLPRH